VRVWKPVAFAVTFGLALPAVSAAATLNVAPGALDDAGSTAGCSAQSGGSFNCVTLRDAVAFANAGMAGANPTIQLAAGTYTLANNALVATVSLTITGTGDIGAGASTIRQTGPGPAVGSQAVGTLTLTLNNLVVTGVNQTGANATTTGPAPQLAGAVVQTNGSLVLNGVAVVGNRSACGAGLAQDGTTQNGTGGSVLGSAITSNGSLSMTNSIVSGNTAIGGPGGSSSGANPAGAGGVGLSAVFAGGSMSISGSTISNNSAIGGAGGVNTGTAAGGAGGVVLGAVFAGASMSISGSTITGNSATGGVGGGAAGANAVAGNGGQAYGAVVFAPASAGETMAVSNTTIGSDTASGGPGGVATGTGGTGGAGGQAAGAALALGGSGAAAQTASVAASTISNNTSSGGAAGSASSSSGTGGKGGVAIGAIDDSSIGSAIPLSISASTISGNRAVSSAGGAGAGAAGSAVNASGGGLRATGGATVTILNSTVSGNSVQSGGGAAVAGLSGGYGGGIASAGTGTTVGLYSDTIAGNSASSALGGQWIFGPDLNAHNSGAFSLEDTAIALPSPNTVSACGSQSGTYTDLGHNLQDSASSTCGLGGAGLGDQLVSSSGLPSALGANGGPTMTLAPKLGSAMIGHGGACINPLVTTTTNRLTVDQRGLPRGATCDIGAFQTQPITVTGKPQITGTPTVGRTLRCVTGSFVATGDGVYSHTGSIGALHFTTLFASNGKPVSRASTYTVTTRDRGHSITCTITAAGAYGQARATSGAVHVPAIVKLSQVSQARSTWAETKTKNGPPVGTTFRYTLNTPATVTLTFVQQKTRRNVGRLNGPGKIGKNALHFNGKVGRHRLAPGRYTITITVKTPNSTSIKTLIFTIA
jgi:hypothetical protein